MMIVVFGDEIEMVYQPHGLSQPRVQHGAGKQFRLKFCYVIDETKARLAEAGQNVVQGAGIVIGFISFTIAEVGGGECVSAC